MQSLLCSCAERLHFAVTLFVAKQARLVSLFFQAAVQFVLLVPLLTMRQFAEERRTGTLELLLTAPVREIDIVLAKFIAAMAVLLAMIGLTLSYALIIAIYGAPDWGPIYSGYLGLACSPEPGVHRHRGLGTHREPDRGSCGLAGILAFFGQSIH